MVPAVRAVIAKGRMIGSPQFLRELAVECSQAVDRAPEALAEARTALHLAWADQTQLLLDSMGRTLAEARLARKSEPWKLAVAAAMKVTSTATNRWLAAHLHLGALHEASRNVSAWRKFPDPPLDAWFRRLTSNHKI